PLCCASRATAAAGPEKPFVFGERAWLTVPSPANEELAVDQRGPAWDHRIAALEIGTVRPAPSLLLLGKRQKDLNELFLGHWALFSFQRRNRFSCCGNLLTEIVLQISPAGKLLALKVRQIMLQRLHLLLIGHQRVDEGPVRTHLIHKVIESEADA